MLSLLKRITFKGKQALLHNKDSYYNIDQYMKESDISFSFLCRPPNKNSQFTKLVMKICYMVCLKLQEHYTMEKWQDFVFLHVPLFHRQRIKANITFSCHTSGLCFFTCARFLQEVQRQSSSNETMNSGQTNKRFSAISPR